MSRKRSKNYLKSFERIPELRNTGYIVLFLANLRVTAQYQLLTFFHVHSFKQKNHFFVGGKAFDETVRCSPLSRWNLHKRSLVAPEKAEVRFLLPSSNQNATLLIRVSRPGDQCLSGKTTFLELSLLMGEARNIWNRGRVENGLAWIGKTVSSFSTRFWKSGDCRSFFRDNPFLRYV